jgi:hypothetical protein
MDKKSLKKFSTMFGWLIDLDVSGKIKCAVLGRLVEGKTALLNLRSIDIFLFVHCLLCRSFSLNVNILQIGDRLAFQHPPAGGLVRNTELSAITKLSSGDETSPIANVLLPAAVLSVVIGQLLLLMVYDRYVLSKSRKHQFQHFLIFL